MIEGEKFLRINQYHEDLETGNRRRMGCRVLYIVGWRLEGHTQPSIFHQTRVSFSSRDGCLLITWLFDRWTPYRFSSLHCLVALIPCPFVRAAINIVIYVHDIFLIYFLFSFHIWIFFFFLYILKGRKLLFLFCVFFLLITYYHITIIFKN